MYIAHSHGCASSTVLFAFLAISPNQAIDAVVFIRPAVVPYLTVLINPEHRVPRSRIGLKSIAEYFFVFRGGNMVQKNEK